MPIYPPRNTATKKKQILEYRIFEFVSLLEKESSVEKMNKKAEAVRTAMLNLIKARLVLTRSYKVEDKSDVSVQLRKKLNVDKTKWENYTLYEIRDYCIKHGYEN